MKKQSRTLFHKINFVELKLCSIYIPERLLLRASEQEDFCIVEKLINQKDAQSMTFKFIIEHLFFIVILP
jgi:hypothetical protein